MPQCPPAGQKVAGTLRVPQPALTPHAAGRTRLNTPFPRGKLRVGAKWVRSGNGTLQSAYYDRPPQDADILIFGNSKAFTTYGEQYSWNTLAAGRVAVCAAAQSRPFA